MSIGALLNPFAGDKLIHAVYTGEELIDMATPREEDHAEEEEDQVQLSTAGKLAALAYSIKQLDVSNPRHSIAYKVLQELQTDLRASKTVQSTLDS